MPVPDFAPNEVLTASAMDRVGLWLIKTDTIGTAVTSHTTTSAFNADFANYRVVVSRIDCSVANTDLFVRFAVGNHHFSSFTFVNVTGTGAVGVGRLNGTGGLFVSSTSTLDATSFSMDIHDPFEARRTVVTSLYNATDTSGWGCGYESPQTSRTSFELFPAAGTMTGGTIRVYGYRN